MVTNLRVLLTACAAVGLLACGLARAASDDDANVQGPLNTSGHARNAEASPKRAANLAQSIEKEFIADPLFQDARMNIDLYNGLAIVHGAAPTAELVRVINDKLSHTDGIHIVYNYMVTPDKPEPTPSNIAVTYEGFRRIDQSGMTRNSFTLTQRVQDRLVADPALAGFEFEIDAFLGLIILHGTVDSAQEAARAKEIAIYAEGVDHVLSFIDVTDMR